MKRKKKKEFVKFSKEEWDLLLMLFNRLLIYTKDHPEFDKEFDKLLYANGLVFMTKLHPEETVTVSIEEIEGLNEDSVEIKKTEYEDD